ncbi:fungal hydrophobin [Phlegmacium glaucopus]|nr:fungal hydrophobin [Phlegmacium glaucopus]
MQFKVISTLTFVTLVAAAIAPPFPGNPLPTIGASKCKSGELHCCKTSESPTAASGALGPLGIPPSTISGLVGVDCTPITVTGGGKPSCPTKPLCCTDNSHNGVSLGCNPVNLDA